jgi:hypothetical protein
LQRADYTAIGRLSHALKGMTTLVGADRLTTLLQTWNWRRALAAEATEQASCSCKC